jgi:hypothetical protein
VRNAIGLPVGHAEGLVRGDGVRHEAPALAQGRAAGALGIAAGGSGSLAKLQGSLGGMRIVYPSPSPTAAKVMPNPANLGGNIVVRRGAGASGVVGGPAKTVAGINGTAIRPKH